MNINRIWWKAAFVRALKTVAQTAVASLGTAAVLSDVNWLAVLSASALAGVLSLLTSLAGLPEVREEQTDDEGSSPVMDRREEMLRNIREMPIDELQDMICEVLDESGIVYQMGGDSDADR